ncbi:MAG: penicillin-binding protein [Oscillospiraceae bacterium]|nr:penicillin-binding protein [Oscillospiraceae bacterium]
MRKVQNRAASVMLIAILCIAGLFVYISRYVTDGGDWVGFASNLGLYAESTGGGRVYDRNGVLLADAKGRDYSDDYTTRLANYHLLGDYEGRTGSGVLTWLGDDLLGFDLVNGSYQLSTPVLQLTIDSELNKAAYAALAGRAGSVQIVNYKTGEMLCQVSAPVIDPDNPANVPDGAYINRAIAATFTPGSVYKIITMVAALNEVDDIYTRRFTCTGSVDIQGIPVNCTGKHGTQDIKHAFANSCNCAFAEIAQLVGSENMTKYSEKLGLTKSHKLSGIPTWAGNYETFPDGSVELSWSAIGQATNLTCPYSMLRVVAAIANEGTLCEPTLIPYDKKPKTTNLIDENVAWDLKEFMKYNVELTYGKGSFPGLNIGAKTGTAEVGDGTDHAWFVGFLDDAEHPYAFVVQVERGGGGLSVAGSIANKVLQAAVAR